MRRPALPISTRLTLFYGLTLLLLLSAFAVFCYTGFHIAVHRSFDRHLAHEERELRPFVTATASGPRFEGLERLRSVAYQTDGIYGTYVRLLTPEGAVRYQSPNFAGHAPLPVGLPAGAAATSKSVTWEGLPARARYVPLHHEGRLAGWLEVTGFEWSLHHEVHAFGKLLVLGVLGSTLFALVGGGWLARRTLRPVAAMTDAARQMSRAEGPGALAARLPADFGPPDELSELAATFNGLLARLEASVARERRFTSNAAHELLTPLATLRSEAEVALRRERDAPAYRAALQNLLLDAERMTATVHGLLHLARAEALPPPPGPPLDLSALVAERVAHARPTAEAHRLTLADALAPGLLVATDAAPLADVVDNLLSNAVKYTPAGGRVCVALAHDPAHRQAVLRVSDTGIGFTTEEADLVFDRFYRSDAPLVQAAPGSGLGLSVVQAVVEAYGGRVHAQSGGPGNGATFEVRLPCAEAPPPRL